MSQKLTREQLELLMGDKNQERQQKSDSSSKNWIQAWLYWRKQGERWLEKFLYQKELPLLFKKILFTYRQQCLFPSDENAENFLNAKADLKVHLLENAWRSNFRRYWKTDGSSLFMEISLK